jgi:hypothetical protein
MHFRAGEIRHATGSGHDPEGAESLIGQRTSLINTVRGHAAEFGIISGKGAGKITPLLSAVGQEATIPTEAQEMFTLLGQQIYEIDVRIKDIDVKLTAAHKASEISQRLVTIPGAGPEGSAPISPVMLIVAQGYASGQAGWRHDPKQPLHNLSVVAQPPAKIFKTALVYKVQHIVQPQSGRWMQARTSYTGATGLQPS